MKRLIHQLITSPEIFQSQPLVLQRRSLGTNGRLADPDIVQNFINQSRFDAGMSFLERIHNEIENGMTPEQIRERKMELAYLDGQDPTEAVAGKQVTVADIVTDQLKMSTPKTKAPELTDEYLQKLGIPTNLSAMSNDEPVDIETIEQEAVKELDEVLANTPQVELSPALCQSSVTFANAA